MSLLDDVDRNMPILVVDDLSTTRRVVCNCLRKLGFDNVTEASDVEQAIFQLHSNEFQFVISNWDLLSANGVDPAALARSSKDKKTLPFVVVVSSAQKKAGETATQKKGQCIVKPFTAELLREKMENALDSQK